jgi:4-amino-4-deoxy-L-arabinose transferase-like glycosyltransferase
MLRTRWEYLLAVCLLWALFAQTALTAARTSLTIDEGLHITSGYSILRTGDFRLIEEHPPLIKALAALPLLSVPDLADPRTLPEWDARAGEADTVHLVRVMKHWLQPYRPFDRVVFATRVPIMLLSLLLGAVVWRWASDLAGRLAGLLALALYAFDPNIVAHSSVAAIDLGAAAFITLAMYALWRVLRRPTRAGVVLAGVTLGLAQAARISALLLLPLFVLLIGLRAWERRDPDGLSGLLAGRWAQAGAILLAIFALAGVTLWAVYGFEVRTLPGWSFPLPAATHLIPLERVRADLSTGRPVFLMGQVYERGQWFYFPVAFAIKTPLPTLILLVAASAFALRSLSFVFRRSSFVRPPSSILRHLPLVAFPLLYFAGALVQPFNIGYRHLLPVLPFLFVFIACWVLGVANRIGSRMFGNVTLSPPQAKLGRYLVIVLLVWNAFGTVRMFPNYLAYFNELVGGPGNGYKWLVDSNVDWGQGWKQLKAYMDAHEIARVKFAQFSSNDPAAYGIDYEPLAPMAGAPPVLPARYNPAPGVYVLSASSLQGVPLADVNSYDYFRQRTPTARIGYALFVYDVKPLDPKPGWVAQCAAPAPPLELPDVTEGFGRDDLRLVYFDCQQAWVWPGQASGWWVLPYALTHDPNAFARRWVEPSGLTFEQKQSLALPPYSIFTFQISNHKFQKDLTAPDAPTTLGDTVELLGYAVDRATARPGQSVELLTLWRVIGLPPAPLSVMAHLLSSDGQPIAVGDGLGFTADQWQAGDVFVQRNVLQIPANALAGAFEVRVGLYTLDTIQRLPVFQNGAAVGDSLRLAQLSIRP